MPNAIKDAHPAIIGITTNPLVVDLQKYVNLENVNLVSHYPAATKSGISIGVIIAGIILAILLFKR